MSDEATLSHIPVLLSEVLEALTPRDGETYIDATFGGGGYTKAILDKANCHVIGIDRDELAFQRGCALKDTYPERFSMHHAKFSEIPDALAAQQIIKVDGIVFDLGISSYQIDDPDRGFSFRFDAPLAMTMGRNDLTAYDVVNEFSEKEIADILYAGEERHGRRIARAIVKAREEKPIETTFHLADLIKSVLPKTKDAQHPATLAFQAIRIFVNNELIELANALNFCKNILGVNGRIVIVTFHSLEDRMVKHFLRKESGNLPLPSRHVPIVPEREAPYFMVPKGQPIAPSDQETRSNPRARSAKLRYGIRTAFHQEETLR